MVYNTDSGVKSGVDHSIPLKPLILQYSVVSRPVTARLWPACWLATSSKMTKVRVEPGICGFTTLINAESEDGMMTTLTVDSKCGRIQKLVAGLDEEINAYSVCMPHPAQLFEENELHAACPVVAGIVKAIEAECGLALKKDVQICFVD